MKQLKCCICGRQLESRDDYCCAQPAPPNGRKLEDEYREYLEYLHGYGIHPVLVDSNLLPIKREG